MRNYGQITIGRIGRISLLLFALLPLTLARTQAGVGNSITSPDTARDVGLYTSLVLDADGYPVVSYYDTTNGDLKLLHCNDPNCNGNDESITAPDTQGDVGQYTSLALDGDGYPVVSYSDITNGDLKLLHCNDPDCNGGDESITSPDTMEVVGRYASLALDSSGFPVVSYYDSTNEDLKLLHCNDPNCSGGDESITAPDTAGDVGRFTSLMLDGSGYPVVSYEGVKLLHCNDPDCSGNDESITTPDSEDFQGTPSLALDQNGYPVVSYVSLNFNQRIMHCNDPNCSGGDESITTTDTDGFAGFYSSLVLDNNGYPIVSHNETTGGDLKLLHCNDADCSGGDESIVFPDTTGRVGAFTSLALDGDGYPVVSYYDETSGNLKVLHCNDPNCAGSDESITAPDTGDRVTGGDSVTSPDSAGDVGADTSLALDADGYPVVTYDGPGGLKLLHCNDPDCRGADESITSLDIASGAETASLELDGSGFPVVVYYESISDGLGLLHCNDPNCIGGDESVTAPATVGNVGAFRSLALDANGYPVVSYWDASDVGLKLLHCNDANCSGGDESITAPDTNENVGWFTSLALDNNGHPVVGYYDITNSDLKLMHCNDANCSGGDESITSPDTDGAVGQFPSLVLDANGYPVVSYWDQTNGDLKLLHCNDPNCSGDDESITSPDSAAEVGAFTSLALDGDGNPVVSYYDWTNEDLKLLHCNDPNCSGSDEYITVPDDIGDVGRYTSLALDGDGNPVVSYYDLTNEDLMLLHCNDPNCSVPPIAEAGGPYSGIPNYRIHLSGAGASTVYGGPLTYTWEVDSLDCTFSDDTVLNPFLTCSSVGDFTATLTVDDGLGTESDTVTVNVIAPERAYIPIVLKRADD